MCPDLEEEVFVGHYSGEGHEAAGNHHATLQTTPHTTTITTVTITNTNTTTITTSIIIVANQ
jgi:hypothetical protein